MNAPSSSRREGRPPDPGRRLFGSVRIEFLLLGTLLYFGHAFLARYAGDATRPRIVLSRQAQAELGAELAAELGRTPSAAEFEEAVARWRLEEVAYREALKRGLDRGDPVVRRQVVNKLLETNRQLAPVSPPSAAQLDAWLGRHRDRYVAPVRYDFEHVYCSAKRPDPGACATGLSSELERGAEPRGLGDEFHFGHTFLGRTRQSIATEFGDGFADRLSKSKSGVWTVIRSEHGVHVVRLLERTGGKLPEPAVLRAALERDWVEAMRQQRARQALERIAAGYRFVEEK